MQPNVWFFFTVEIPEVSRAPGLLDGYEARDPKE